MRGRSSSISWSAAAAKPISRDERVDYAPGALMIIPRGALHSIVAGDTGMVLMALFSPAVN